MVTAPRWLFLLIRRPGEAFCDIQCKKSWHFRRKGQLGSTPMRARASVFLGQGGDAGELVGVALHEDAREAFAIRLV